MVLKRRLLREFHGSGAQTRLCRATFTFTCTMCHQRHVGLLARDRSVTTAQPRAGLGTSDKCPWLQQPTSVCSGALSLFLFHRAEQNGKKEIPFPGEIPQQSVGQKVFAAFPKPFVGQEGCDLCPGSSASGLLKSSLGRHQPLHCPVPPGHKAHVLWAGQGWAGQHGHTAPVCLAKACPGMGEPTGAPGTGFTPHSLSKVHSL